MFVKSFLCYLVLSISFVASTCAIGNANSCKNIDVQWLRLHAPTNAPFDEIKILSKKQIDTICEVTISRKNKKLILYTGDNYFIIGNMFQAGNNLTNNKLSELQKETFLNNIENIQKAVAFEYNPPQIKNDSNVNNKTIYMFTDPLCPYCDKVGDQVKNISDKYGVPVKTLLFNVHGEKGKKKSVEAVCRKFTLPDYIEDEWKKSESKDEYQCKAGEALYELSMKESLNIGVNSVPQFFLSDGSNIKGADIKALEKALLKY